MTLLEQVFRTLGHNHFEEVHALTDLLVKTELVNSVGDESIQEGPVACSLLGLLDLERCLLDFLNNGVGIIWVRLVVNSLIAVIVVKTGHRFEIVVFLLAEVLLVDQN